MGGLRGDCYFQKTASFALFGAKLAYHMSHGLNSLKGDYIGDYIGTIMGVIKGHTRSLDYSSYNTDSDHVLRAHPPTKG